MKYKEDNYYYDIIRNNISKYRKECGVTQLELSNKIGCSLSYISSIESKHKNKRFSILILGKIANVLNIDIRDFFNM